MIGRTIGRFHVLSKLGQGGLATVWTARDQLLGRQVALKILDEKLADSAKVRRRFLHEAQAAAVLDHPGIVRVHDAGEDGGVAYIALSLIDGETLSERIARRLMPIEEAVRIVAAAAEALGHAHERGVIHRDVTSRNIMVARDGRVIVLDFGLALAVWESRVTSTETAMGTAHFMSPEVIQGRQADERSDIYGLGVVLYEALTGTFPFHAEQSQAAFYATVNLDPVSPAERRPEIPPGLTRVVMKAISRDRERRHATAGELLADLCAAGRERPPDRRAAPGPPAGGAGARLRGERRDGNPWYLVVAPFRAEDSTSSPDDACASLAGRLADTISRALAGVAGVHVVQPQAGTDGDPKELARESGANVVLSGSVARSGSQLRVSYSLLDPWRGIQVAGGVSDGSAFRIFDLEDEVAAAVSRSLGGPRTPAAGGRGSRPPDPAARDRYQQALAYLKRHDNDASVDGAITLLERLLATDSESALYHAALARAYLYKCENTQERLWESRAAAACQRAKELGPDLDETALALGHLHTSTGDHDRAIPLYRRALPGAARFDALLGLARAHASAGRLLEARGVCRDAVAAAPEDGRGHSMLGWIHYQAADYEAAAAEWRTVVELAPDHARGWRNLGAALYRMERYAEAQHALERSLAIRPNDEAYGNLGTALYFLGRGEEALAALRKAADLAPANPIRWGNLGNACLWIEGHAAEAERAHDRAIALMTEKLERNPAFADGWSRLAEWLAHRGRRDEALAAIRTAQELAPGDVRGLVRAGYVYYELGDRPRCLESFRKAVEGGCAPGELAHSRELAPLRGDPEFLRLIGTTFPAARSNDGDEKGGRQ